MLVVLFKIWHVGSTPAETVIALGVPSVGPITTVRMICADGPLQPLAVTRISTEPKKPLVQVITPVEAFMAPAEELLILQLSPVLFAAVVA